MLARARTSASARTVRGEFVDIGDRRLRIVRVGARSARPTIVCEHGAFGCAADWAVVQARLAGKGLHSLAYDRAGLGWSDPGPRPRDGRNIAKDLEALLDAAEEPGPFVLVGHSMGGLFVRQFAMRNPDTVLGVVLVDAATPEASDNPVFGRGVEAYRMGMQLVGASAFTGYMRPLAMFMGDSIGLPKQISKEKRRIWGSSRHVRWSAQEVWNWPNSARQAREAGVYDKAMPVAVVTAGSLHEAPVLKAIQAAPAAASAHGYVEHVAHCNHASLLGEKFADPVVRGVEYVLAASRVEDW